MPLSICAKPYASPTSGRVKRNEGGSATPIPINQGKPPQKHPKRAPDIPTVCMPYTGGGQHTERN
jgi:hypothetical protein